LRGVRRALGRGSEGKEDRRRRRERRESGRKI
jgi:hypothetical protein